MAAYLVEIERPVEPGKRLVRASTAAQALRHVWRQTTVVTALSPDETLSAIIEDGLKPEDARAPEEVATAGPAGESYAHKLACPAASTTPIGKGDCRCPDLDM